MEPQFASDKGQGGEAPAMTLASGGKGRIRSEGANPSNFSRISEGDEDARIGEAMASN